MVYKAGSARDQGNETERGTTHLYEEGMQCCKIAKVGWVSRDKTRKRREGIFWLQKTKQSAQLLATRPPLLLPTSSPNARNRSCSSTHKGRRTALTFPDASDTRMIPLASMVTWGGSQRHSTYDARRGTYRGRARTAPARGRTGCRTPRSWAATASGPCSTPASRSCGAPDGQALRSRRGAGRGATYRMKR